MVKSVNTQKLHISISQDKKIVVDRNIAIEKLVFCDCKVCFVKF